MIPKGIVNKRSVPEALQDMRWIGDIHGIATVALLIEFLSLWEVVSDTTLQQGVQDKHVWCPSNTGQYSAKSAYDALLQGSTQFAHGREYGNIGHKANAGSSFGWSLTIIVDRELWWEGNLPHPGHCLFCDQEQETIIHLLSSFVFIQQFWLLFLQQVGLGGLSPQPTGTTFEEWWFFFLESWGMVMPGLFLSWQFSQERSEFSRSAWTLVTPEWLLVQWCST